MDEDVLAVLRRAHWSFASLGRPEVIHPDLCVLCNEPYPCATSRALDVALAARAYRAAYDADTDEEERATRRALDEALAALDGT